MEGLDYKAAAEDLAANRETEAAATLAEEVCTQIAEKRPRKEFVLDLQAKGMPRHLTLAVMTHSETVYWKRALSSAGADIAGGHTQTASVADSLRYVETLLAEDPRTSTLESRLAGMGASPALITFLTASESVRSSQRQYAVLGVFVGIVLVALGLWGIDVRTGQSSSPAAFVSIVIGLGLLGKGLLTLLSRGRRSKANSIAKASGV